MRLPHLTRSVVVGLLVTAVAVPASFTAARADTSTTTITVTVNTPDGVAANVELDGPSHRVVAKQAHGTSRTATVTVPAGTYTVTPDTANYHGQLYDGVATPATVTVTDGGTASVSVTYTGDPTSAYNLHLTDLTATSASFAWDAPSTGPFALRRTDGKTPAATPTDGVGIDISGQTATDSGLAPGASYSYALFTNVRGSWVGPTTLALGTAPEPGSTAATYVTLPGTMLPANSDIVTESTTGDSVVVTFQPDVVLPVMGAAVVLPQSPTLPGGYLGAVTDISLDGHYVVLQGTGMSAAFAYYSLDIAQFSSGPIHLTPDTPETAATSMALAQPATDQPRVEPTPEPMLAPMATSSESCFGGSTEFSLAFDPAIELNGSFHASITHGWFGIPDGATMDASLGATVTGPMDVETTAQIACVAPFKPIMQTITVDPVPISFYLTPKAELTLGGGINFENLGVTVSAGVQFSGHIGVSGMSFSSTPYFNASLLPATVNGNGEVGAKVGGQVIFGPGAGSSGAGVIAGVSGEWDPINATFGPFFAPDDGHFNDCLVADVGGIAALGLTAKAWIADFSVSGTYDLWKTDWSYGHWDSPDGCENWAPEPPGPTPTPTPTPTTTPTQPGDSVLGPGVTKVSDSTEGAPAQIGYVSGLVPGHNTWLLSSGQVASAVGVPSYFASSDMGMPGDADLSALSGNPTYDAAAYEVTLVPTGSTLHVKYVFASEEYPEYVGSMYNDVMEVTVNGTNCALVPGTSTPVSINTINDHTNAQYYVDNSTGASGYYTSYDGLTVPLTCNVAVTPGQQVTVKIAVADASDHIYDSGVALLDQGIWSD